MKQAILESTVIQGLVTLVLVGVVGYLSVVGQPIPDLLTNALMIVLGFWFGSKTGIETAKRTRYGQSNS